MSFLSWLLFLHFVCPQYAQLGPPGYTSDNSDWWSITGRPESDESIPDQNREPSALNFKILGISLRDKDVLKSSAARLGKASEVERGDASTGRFQVCYVSNERNGSTHLIFEQGELNQALYLFEAGPDWNGSDLCAKSGLVKKGLSLASGLALGQTPTEVRKLLGRPSVGTSDKLIYSFSVRKRTSASDLKKFREASPELSDEEFREDYEFYTLGAYIEARFLKGKMVYLAISRLEVY